MWKRNGVISACAVSIVLTTVACGSSSTAASSSSSSSDSVAASAAPGATSASSAAASGGAAAASGAPAAGSTVGDTSDTLDAASTTWFTALCTGLSGLKADSTKMQSAGAVGTDTEKLKALSPVLLDISSQYTNTAMTLTSLPSPGFPGGSDYAQKAIAAFGELGDAFQAAGTTAANGDNSKVATLTADSTSGPGAQAMSAIAVTAQTKAAINKIPVCASSGVMS